ncbi:UNVERIFIED_CONTAM: hypothetical protein K2H54_059905, partial [Gekko kuhli]
TRKRKPEYAPALANKTPETTILVPEVFAKGLCQTCLADEIRTDQAADPWAQQRLQDLQQGTSGLLSTKDGLLFHQDRLYIPPGPLRAWILRLTHDSLPTGDFGRQKTAHLLTLEF